MGNLFGGKSRETRESLCAENGSDMEALDSVLELADFSVGKVLRKRIPASVCKASGPLTSVKVSLRRFRVVGCDGTICNIYTHSVRLESAELSSSQFTSTGTVYRDTTTSLQDSVWGKASETPSRGRRCEFDETVFGRDGGMPVLLLALCRPWLIDLRLRGWREMPGWSTHWKSLFLS